jgi:hypothetical protein
VGGGSSIDGLAAALMRAIGDGKAIRHPGGDQAALAATTPPAATTSPADPAPAKAQPPTPESATPEARTA